MNRLTKVCEIHDNKPINYCSRVEDYPKAMGYEHIQADIDCINKLGQLEDIEEELGIDLITLFKALKDGIYVVEDNDNYIVKDSIKSIENWADGWGISTNMEYLELSFSDYGKTWALDKKELEEND